MIGIDGAVPTHRRCCIGAGEIGIPVVSHTVGVIAPVHAPAINGSRAVVGNANGGLESRIPGINNDIFTNRSISGTAPGKSREAQPENRERAKA